MAAGTTTMEYRPDVLFAAGRSLRIFVNGDIICCRGVDRRLWHTFRRPWWPGHDVREQSPVGASRVAALDILAMPLVLLRCPPSHPGASAGFVLSERRFHATGEACHRMLSHRERVMANDVTIIRLYVMRFVYLLNFVVLGLDVWPTNLQHAGAWERVESAADGL